MALPGRGVEVSAASASSPQSLHPLQEPRLLPRSGGSPRLLRELVDAPAESLAGVREIRLGDLARVGSLRRALREARFDDREQPFLERLLTAEAIERLPRSRRRVLGRGDRAGMIVEIAAASAVDPLAIVLEQPCRRLAPQPVVALLHDHQ